MAIQKANEPVHGHPSQSAHEELAPYGVGAAYQHHLRVERSEMCFEVLHPREGYLGSHECVGDHPLENRLRERRRELPWWSGTLGLIHVE